MPLVHKKCLAPLAYATCSRCGTIPWDEAAIEPPKQPSPELDLATFRLGEATSQIVSLKQQVASLEQQLQMAASQLNQQDKQPAEQPSRELPDYWSYITKLVVLLVAKYKICAEDLAKLNFEVEHNNFGQGNVRTIRASFLTFSEGLTDPVPYGYQWPEIAACNLAAAWWPDEYEIAEFGKRQPTTLEGLKRRIDLAVARHGRLCDDEIFTLRTSKDGEVRIDRGPA